MYTKTHQIVPLFKIFSKEHMPPKHSIYRTIEPPSTLTISLCLYKK